MSDYYEILGVEKNATKDEIMDDEKRATYDRYGEDGLREAGFNTQGPFAGGFGDLEEVFNSFFGGGFGGGFGFGGGRQRDPNAPQRGDDLRLDISLDFEEAVFGLTREVKIDHLEECPTCKGTGAKEGSKPETCKQCGGQGRIQQTTRTVLGHFTQIVTCPHCHGKGTVISNPCPDCHGEGRKNVEKKIEVKIPAGVDNGSKMRLSHEGDAGQNGGIAGDLYIVIHVNPSSYYQRDGINVLTKLDITPAQAVLGDTVKIKTLDGEKAVTIPAGTQHGDVVKIKGAGVPSISKPSLRGDHLVVVSVKVPTKISNEERVLYSKLLELQSGQKQTTSAKERIKGMFK